jgi:hypothetical protein
MDSIQLTNELNKRFGLNMTPNAVKCLRYREGFKGKQPPMKHQSKLYPQEVEEYIKSHFKGTGPKAMAEEVNRIYGTSYTHCQMKGYYGRNKLDSGVTGYIQKGNVPFNKGMKMPPHVYEKAKHTMFKKGQVPHNTVPVGTEVVTDDGYIKVKTAEPNKWRFKHRLVWQQYRGEIPKGMVICFKDGNPLNTDIGNLAMLDRREHLEMTRRGYRSENPGITEAGIYTLRLENKCRELRKEKGNGE